MKCISINPQRTTTDEVMGAEWVPIIPNTDTALFLAMSHHLLVTNRWNRDFVQQYTVGFDRFRAYLEGKDADGTPAKTPEWASRITGIPAARIRQLADLFASKRTQLAGSWAIQRAHHGEMPYWAIVNFACMLGNIGLPGQGVGFSWHYGGGGTPQSGATPPTGLSQGRNAVKKICPASRISEMLNNPGKEFTHNGSRYTYPLVKLIYNAGNNFMSHQQDLNELIRALQKVDTVVVQDCWWTASTRWADIVLPATTTVERNDISSGGTYNINKFYAMKQVVAPVGEALDDFEIFRRLAELCGVELGFTEGLEQMDYVQAAYEKSSAAKIIPFEEFWEKGVVTLPTPEAAHSWVRHGDFRADPVKNPLHTPSGRIEMYSATIEKMNLPDCPPMPKWLEPGEYLGNAKEGQLHVVSPHPYMRLHSQMANAEPLRKTYAVQTRKPLLINTQDARKRGIRDGDLVELYNERGALVVGARVSDRIMPGVVSIYDGCLAATGQQGSLQQRSGELHHLQPAGQRAHAGHHGRHLPGQPAQMHRCRSGRQQGLPGTAHHPEDQPEDRRSRLRSGSGSRAARESHGVDVAGREDLLPALHGLPRPARPGAVHAAPVARHHAEHVPPRGAERGREETRA